jgi:hypothetical protein
VQSIGYQQEIATAQPTLPQRQNGIQGDAEGPATGGFSTFLERHAALQHPGRMSTPAQNVIDCISAIWQKNVGILVGGDLPNEKN